MGNIAVVGPLVRQVLIEIGPDFGIDHAIEVEVDAAAFSPVPARDAFPEARGFPVEPPGVGSGLASGEHEKAGEDEEEEVDVDNNDDYDGNNEELDVADDSSSSRTAY